MPDTLRAIILMVAGSFFFALGDMFMKLASQTVPIGQVVVTLGLGLICLLYTSPSPRDKRQSRMPSSA